MERCDWNVSPSPLSNASRSNLWFAQSFEAIPSHSSQLRLRNGRTILVCSGQRISVNLWYTAPWPGTITSRLAAYDIFVLDPAALNVPLSRRILFRTRRAFAIHEIQGTANWKAVFDDKSITTQFLHPKCLTPENSWVDNWAASRDRHPNPQSIKWAD